VVPLAAAIDAPQGEREGHAPLRPSLHLLECRTHNPDQVTTVLAAQVRFELPTVISDIWLGHYIEAWQSAIAN
jgi:hypothetical protein